MDYMTYKTSKRSRIYLPFRLALLFIFVICFQLSFSQVTFAPFIATATGSAPSVVCIGDVNNDGRNDVVLCTRYGINSDSSVDNKTFVFIQNEANTLNSPIIYSNSQNTAYSISICDLNNDNLNDIILGFDDSIGIFYQNEQGSLNALKTYYGGSPNSIDGLSTGDLNGDGLLDIAISHFQLSTINILSQNFTGAVNSELYPIPNISSNHVLKVGDINGDKRDDIIVAMSEGIYSYTQSALGFMNPFVYYDNGNTGYLSSGLSIGDLNNDGLNDVVQSISDNSSKASLQVFYQDKTTHKLQGPSQLSALATPEPIIIADLNCDNKNEIIVTNGGNNKISVYIQNNNTYNTYNSFPIDDALHYNPYGLCIGDI